MDKPVRRNKKLSKQVILTIICCVLAITLLQLILLLVNPMRRSESLATNYILRLTPIGTDMDEVIRIIENHRNWNIARINREQGFAHPRQGGLSIEQGRTIVGEKSIRVDMRRYIPFVFFPFMETNVSMFWAFDEDGKLIEVYVWKSSR